MTNTLHIHLKAHRRLRRFTQSQVAELMGMSHNALSDKELGKKPVTLEELEKLAKIYGCHPAALLMAPSDSAKADLIRRAAHVAATRPAEAAEHWIKSGEHMIIEEKTSP